MGHMNGKPDVTIVNNEMTARAQIVADELRGTTQSLEAVTSEAERNSKIFCEVLDAEVFECQTCNWWCGRDEESDTTTDVCDECQASEDGENDEED